MKNAATVIHLAAITDATRSFDNKEQVEALRKGLIEMVYTAGSYYTSVIPEIDMPPLFPPNILRNRLLPWTILTLSRMSFG